MKRSPLPLWILKVALIHLMAKNLAFALPNLETTNRASVSSWAFEQIETQRAQELTRSHYLPNNKVVVAVVDTGIDIKHPALKDQLWTNPGEIPDNGIDDDHNGFIDDVHGWNFVKNNDDLTDTQGHGTHIAGLIAARSPQFSGVAPDAKLMILKYYDPALTSVQNLKNEIAAFQYAIKMKSNIINFSGGGPGGNSEEERILRLAERNQILVVAAAGNDGVDTDRFPYYPANYPLNNIISVTATDSMRQMTSFSNYGLHTTHIAAPGENIRSTAVGGGYIELSGTSQATAIVSGLAALLVAQKKMNPKVLIEKIQAGSRYQLPLLGRVAQPGILSTYRSLAMKSTVESAIELDGDTLSASSSPEVMVTLDPSKAIPHDRSVRLNLQNP